MIKTEAVPFVTFDESRPAGGVAWSAAFLAVAIGLLASTACLAMGQGWLVALAAYIFVGGLGFLLSFAGIYLLLEDEEESERKASPIRGALVPRKATAYDAEPQWAQRSPTDWIADDGRVFHIGSAKPGGLGIVLAEAIAGQGYHVDICDDLHTALSSMTWSPLRWSLVVVDFDDCERYVDLQEIVDDLSDFGSTSLIFPSLPCQAVSGAMISDSTGFLSRIFLCACRQDRQQSLMPFQSRVPTISSGCLASMN